MSINLKDIKGLLEEDENLREKYKICDGEKENVKAFFFPQTENFLELHRDEDGKVDFETKEESPEVKQVLLGVKPCFMEGIKLLDCVFLEEPKDTLYETRRNNTIIISTFCQELEPGCFCTSVGIDHENPGGGDIIIDPESEEVVTLSPKGKEFLQEVFESDREKSSEIENIEVKDTEIQLENHMEKAKRLKESLDEMEDSPLWDELSFRCLGCGLCTYYCPTCHCFDVCEYYRKDTGTRYRTWDSCMFSEFTKMAGGENPRPTRKDRVKNRFYHKFNYLPKKYERLGCVGCGRCLVHCPAGISPANILRELGEMEDEDKSVSSR